jgi:hypothetical protein
MRSRSVAMIWNFRLELPAFRTRIFIQPFSARRRLRVGS